MFEWITNPLKEFEPLSAAYYHNADLIAHSILNGIGIAAFFFLIGIIFIVMAGKGPASTDKKVVASRFIGLAWIWCAGARVLEVVALWHNYAYLIAMFKDITCIFAGIAAIMLPSVIKQVKEQRTLEDIHKKMQETASKLEEVKDISTQIINKHDSIGNNPL